MCVCVYVYMHTYTYIKSHVLPFCSEISPPPKTTGKEDKEGDSSGPGD